MLHRRRIEPRLQFLVDCEEFHRVSGERPRILRLVEQPSGCGVRIPRGASPFRVRMFPDQLLSCADLAGGEDYGYFA
jgi:hypothetical protein